MKCACLALCLAVALQPGWSQTTDDVDYSGEDPWVTPDVVDSDTTVFPSDVRAGTIPPFKLPIWDPSENVETPRQNPFVPQDSVKKSDGSSEIDFVIMPDVDDNSSEVLNISNLRPMVDEIVKSLIMEFNSSLSETTDNPQQQTDLGMGDLDDASPVELKTTQSSRSRIVTNPPIFVLEPIESVEQIQSASNGTPAAPLDAGITPSGQIFCLAQCMAFCTLNQITDNPADCKDFCTQYEQINSPCDEKDTQCWKNCNQDFTDVTKAPKSSPTISGSTFIDDSQFQEQTVKIFWQGIENATNYVVEIIPNPISMINGAVMTRDIATDNYYYFHKQNLCFEYYIRVSAVNSFGIGQFGPSTFIQSTPSQLSLNFQVDDMYSQPSLDDFFTEAVQADTNSRRTMVRMTYADDDSNFNLENFDLKNYLLAFDCIGDVDAAVFEAVAVDNPLSIKAYKVNSVTFAYGERFLFVILPNSVLASNCNYKFGVESVTNTCGKVASFSPPATYSSEVGTSFRLNCDNVRESMCSTVLQPTPMPVLVDTTEQPPPTEEKFLPEQQPEVLGNQPVILVDCQMTGFNVDVVGNTKNDKLNVTIWWDAIINDMTKVYFVRHGTAVRPLFVSSYDDEISFDYEDPVPVVDNNPDVYLKSMKLPSVDKTALHSFQICVSYNGASLDDFPWDSAPKHVVDFVALPVVPSDELCPNCEQNSVVSGDRVEITETKCGDNKPALSWIVVMASLFVAVLCFLLMSIVFIHYTCCRQHRMRKIFVSTIATPETEKPIPIIAA